MIITDKEYKSRLDKKLSNIELWNIKENENYTLIFKIRNTATKEISYHKDTVIIDHLVKWLSKFDKTLHIYFKENTISPLHKFSHHIKIKKTTSIANSAILNSKGQTLSITLFLISI